MISVMVAKLTYKNNTLEGNSRVLNLITPIISGIKTEREESIPQYVIKSLKLILRTTACWRTS